MLRLFLASAGPGRGIVQLKAREAFFSQGSEADSIFHLQKGRAKLTVASAAGKEATVTLFIAGDFLEKNRLRERWDAAWQQPRRSLLAQPSE